MFDAITDPWMFVIAGLLLNLTPGADLAYTVSRAASQGPRAGVVAALGIGAGCLFHVALATLGISAAIAASPLAFSVLKLLGAGYLAWLGAGLMMAARCTLRSASQAPADAAPRAPQPQPQSLARRQQLWRVFRDGALINATNPKVALFFIAFLSQFVRADAPHQTAALWLLGLVFTVNGTLVNSAIGIAAALAAQRLQASRRVGAWLQAALGAGFIGLALKLAWAERR
jgi:threonine/homoserine/homoserine lactone efflux protein